MTEREVCTVEYHIVLTIVSKWIRNLMWSHVIRSHVIFWTCSIYYSIILFLGHHLSRFFDSEIHLENVSTIPFFVFIKTWLEISYKNSKISHVKKTTSVIPVLTRSLGSHHTAFTDRLSTYQRAPLYWTR